MTMNEKERIFITPMTKVYELLEDYPDLEDKLIEIAPVFIKLKNPVLRRTIARVTSLKQAAVIADIPVSDFINKLRAEAGQDPMVQGSKPEEPSNENAPDWLKNTYPAKSYDACCDLENGIHPLPRIMKDISLLTNEQVYTLITPFMPAPLIEKVSEKGFLTWSKSNNGTTVTYIRRKPL